MKTKSPFYIRQNFISPLMCEDIIGILDYTVPDVNEDGEGIASIRYHDKCEDIVYDKFKLLIPNLEHYYSTKVKGTERMNFEWYPEGCKPDLVCSNSSYLRQKWVKTKNRDFTVFLFLSDYQEKTPFDDDYEVYGGKLEFPQHSFGFNPQRGTLIAFPGNPHFLHVTSPILAGDLFQIRWHFTTDPLFIYDPNEFPGDYKSWFRNID